MTPARRILFVTLLDDPGSDRIVAEMGRMGAYCAVVGPNGAFASRSRFARQVFNLPRRGGAATRCLVLDFRLESIVRASAPDMIIPLDDLAARALRDRRLLKRASPRLRRLLEYSLGDVEHFDVACCRQELTALARRLGVRVPREAIAPTLSSARRAAEQFGYPVVLKRELSSGGGGVAIAHDDTGLVAAYRKSWLRAKVKGGLGWIPGYDLRASTALILQEFIPGDLAFRISACANGTELEGVDFVAERRQPWDTRASTRVRGIARSEMAAATREIVSALGLSGIVSLDFILTSATEAYLIEMNPRPIASGHLGGWFGHDVLSATLYRDQQRPPPRNLPPPPEVVALFPREIDLDPSGADLGETSRVYHDVPWEDPEIVDAYASWLDARHPQRKPVLRRLAS